MGAGSGSAASRSLAIDHFLARQMFMHNSCQHRTDKIAYSVYCGDSEEEEADRRTNGGKGDRSPRRDRADEPGETVTWRLWLSPYTNWRHVPDRADLVIKVQPTKLVGTDQVAVWQAPDLPRLRRQLSALETQPEGIMAELTDLLEQLPQRNGPDYACSPGRMPFWSHFFFAFTSDRRSTSTLKGADDVVPCGAAWVTMTITSSSAPLLMNFFSSFCVPSLKFCMSR